MSKFLASGGGSPGSENPDLCCLFVSLSDFDNLDFFGLSPRIKLATKHKKEFQSLSNCKLGENICKNFVRIFYPGFFRSIKAG